MCVRESRRRRFEFRPVTEPLSEQVTLNVYDVGRSLKSAALNRVLRPLGTGIFHCGVEVYNLEWSYSDTLSGEGDGIFCSYPRSCEGHNYCESVHMGETTTSEDDVLKLVYAMQMLWTVKDYDTLRKNCCHFCDDFCKRLGVGPIPDWIMSLAGAGAAALNATNNCRSTCCCTLTRASNATRVELVESQPACPPPKFQSDK